MMRINSYEELRDKLQIRIYDPEFYHDFLEDKVVTYVGDFALTYLATLFDDGNEVGDLVFTKRLLDILRIDIQELHKDAMKNNLNWGTVLFNIEDYMDQKSTRNTIGSINLLDTDVDMDRYLVKMFTLTKSDSTNGASLILHKSIRKKIGNVVRGNYFVLPSSIHELMIVPDRCFELPDLKKVVFDCNETVLRETPTSFLSDKIQWCSMDGTVMRNAETWERNI